MRNGEQHLSQAGTGLLQPVCLLFESRDPESTSYFTTGLTLHLAPSNLELLTQIRVSIQLTSKQLKLSH